MADDDNDDDDKGKQPRSTRKTPDKQPPTPVTIT